MQVDEVEDEAGRGVALFMIGELGEKLHGKWRRL